MELRTIENLLEKYFDAATSTAEENILKEYFSSSDVAPHLEQYKPMFGYFVKEATQEFEKAVPLKPRRQNVKWLSIAASLVVMFSLYALFSNQSGHERELGTYEDPEIAFQETQKALNMLSNQVNVGVSGVEYLGEYEKSKNKIFKDSKK
ncbi:MAG: hypothetical protein BM557_01665 [Flavobacterium sp. MedPE-SWcel]|mgnify:CR=1 FL=1|uniref:hypothetical protein n=1 Tax=uncultured Flavobacterium sp. TaxID=165435 RepID=UPI00091FFF61|nr:hypothetical protein [uncultured Flavobacterium sp.]OIQ22110.1 MAG: hypothetical protein BM557_01665 [Flavobacterium sp. MedPE-SWcel]